MTGKCRKHKRIVHLNWKLINNMYALALINQSKSRQTGKVLGTVTVKHLYTGLLFPVLAMSVQGMQAGKAAQSLEAAPDIRGSRRVATGREEELLGEWRETGEFPGRGSTWEATVTPSRSLFFSFHFYRS